MDLPVSLSALEPFFEKTCRIFGHRGVLFDSPQIPFALSLPHSSSATKTHIPSTRAAFSHPSSFARQFNSVFAYAHPTSLLVPKNAADEMP